MNSRNIFPAALLLTGLLPALKATAAGAQGQKTFEAEVAPPSPIPNNDETEVLAHGFMARNGMIRENEEKDRPRYKISSKWKLTDRVRDQGHELLIMQIVDRVEEKEQRRFEFEVLVLIDNQGQKTIARFEDVYVLPQSVIVKIGHAEPTSGDTSFYYVELAGPSLIAALKSAHSGYRYHGFMGTIIPGGKADFDPTPGRTWRVVDATFDLRRGSTGETLDIQAYQFDADFEGYFSGAIPKRASSGVAGVSVGPWGQSAVLEIITSR